MAEQRNKSFLKELEDRTASFTEEKFPMFERIMERRGRVAALATAAPIGAAPTQPTSTSMLMPPPMP